MKLLWAREQRSQQEWGPGDQGSMEGGSRCTLSHKERAYSFLCPPALPREGQEALWQHVQEFGEQTGTGGGQRCSTPGSCDSSEQVGEAWEIRKA